MFCNLLTFTLSESIFNVDFLKYNMVGSFKKKNLFDNLCLLTGILRPLTFRVVIHILGLKSNILVIVFCSLHFFLPVFFLLCFFFPAFCDLNCLVYILPFCISSFYIMYPLFKKLVIILGFTMYILNNFNSSNNAVLLHV